MRTMLIIAVCEDSNTEKKAICNTIETFLRNQQINGTVFAYDSAEKFISALESKKLRFDIVFMDIIMGDMDGMTCARLIRRWDKLVKIVFLTSSTEYVYEGYEVNASGYLVKPLDAAKVTACLQKTIDEVQDLSKDTIVVTSGGVKRRIPIDDIPYLESRRNHVEVVLAASDERLVVYTTLDDFTQRHPSKIWLRPHKSFVVNFLYIEEYASDSLVLRNGTVIPISRTYRNATRASFYNLLHNK